MIPYIKEQIKLAHILENILSVMSSASMANMSLRRRSINNLNLELIQWKKGLSDWADFDVWDMIDKPLKPSIAGLQYVIRKLISRCTA
jgi:hypothetical protein